jgi:hypothetical protein
MAIAKLLRWFRFDKTETETAETRSLTVPKIALETITLEPTPRLLGLVMIVKDEAHGIIETIKTFRPVIDYWTILDTGSTDGTQDIIRRELVDVPGQLFEEPFVDFSTSRNRALDLHGQSTTFSIMPDSDDRLVGAEALRTFLTQHEHDASSDHAAYGVNIRRGELSYYLPLVARTTAGRRYTGRVHEYSGTTSIQIPNVEVAQHREAKSLEATKARWTRDLELLRADHATDPDNQRTVFYLAQTLDCLGQIEEALAMYELRVKMGGWVEETFEAKLRCAHMMRRLNRPWPEVQQAFLDAHVLDKRRAEPLYAIAAYWYYDAKDNLPLTYLFARRAMELPRPNATLFVDQDVYDWKAAHLVAIAGFYLDEEAKKAGAVAAERATAAHGEDELIRANRAFYKHSAAEIFGATFKHLAFKPEAPFVASNPSVHFDGKMWRCLVRTLNYHIVDGWSYVPHNGVICTQNVMLELTPELEIARVVAMADHDQTPRTEYPVHGFEDCRLFRIGGCFYCTATVCDFTVEGRREIVLCEIDDNYAITRATPLRGPWSTQDQKNWMPILDSAKIVYSLLPTAVLELSIGISSTATETDDLPPIANRHLRGGSQLVPFDGGYLCLIHDVVWSGRYRIYTHRFVWLDAELVVRKMSDLFYFEHRGIEYCAGLAYDGKRLVASYSVNDSSANLATFDPERVRASLREEYVV